MTKKFKKLDISIVPKRRWGKILWNSKTTLERDRLLEAVAEAAREYMKALQDDRKPFPPREEFYKLDAALGKLKGK